jgi:hypothetical protein
MGVCYCICIYASCYSCQYPKRLPDTASDSFLKHVQPHIIVTPEPLKKKKKKKERKKERKEKKLSL